MKQMRIIIIVVLSMLASMAKAQLVVGSDEERLMTGAPVVAHGLYYTGEVKDVDGTMIPSFQLADVYILNKLVFKNSHQAKRYYRIANNIKKVYPIALDIQRTVNKTIAHIDSLPTKKEKDAYIKQAEKDLKAEYYPRLKKLTFTQGKLLIKLVDRQCNMTSYELIKTYMGNFKAGFYNAFASLFGASLKKEYDPECDDRLTERAILLIESGQM